MAGSAGEVLARCHCGDVVVRMAVKPTKVAHCNCSLCTALGWRGVYFRSGQIEIQGALDSYVRSDIEQPTLRVFRCARCGTATHWEPLTPPPHARMGVNANLLEPAHLEGAEEIKVDGRGWKG